MVRRRWMAGLAVAAAGSLFWCGCTRSGGDASAAQKLGGSFTTEMTMTVEDLTAEGTLCRMGEGVWQAAFVQPASLDGVVLDFQDGEVTASYKGLAFSVPQTAMPAKSALLQLITVVDTLAQEETITGESDSDGYIAVEGELEGTPYTLRLTEHGDLASFVLDSYAAELTFSKFQSGTAVATPTETAALS